MRSTPFWYECSRLHQVRQLALHPESTLKTFEELEIGMLGEFMVTWAAGKAWSGKIESRGLFEMWTKLKLKDTSTLELRDLEAQPGPSTGTVIEGEPVQSFEGNLFWPDAGDQMLYHGHKFPLATTSKDLKEYHDRKEKQKQKKPKRQTGTEWGGCGAGPLQKRQKRV